MICRPEVARAVFNFDLSSILQKEEIADLGIMSKLTNFQESLPVILSAQ